MPVNKFGHYSMLISYIDLYYLLNETEKAQKLVLELSTVFEEKLSYYSQFGENDIERVFNEIERSLLMYDQVVKTTAQFDDETFVTQLKSRYVEHLKLFEFLIGEE